MSCIAVAANSAKTIGGGGQRTMPIKFYLTIANNSLLATKVTSGGRARDNFPSCRRFTGFTGIICRAVFPSCVKKSRCNYLSRESDGLKCKLVGPRDSRIAQSLFCSLFLSFSLLPLCLFRPVSIHIAGNGAFRIDRPRL